MFENHQHKHNCFRGLLNLRLFRILPILNRDYIILFANPLLFDKESCFDSSILKEPESNKKLKYMYFFRGFSGLTKGFYLDVSITTKNAEETTKLIEKFGLKKTFALPRDNEKDINTGKLNEIYFLPLVAMMEWEENEYLLEIYNAIYSYLSDVSEEKVKSLATEVGTDWNCLSKYLDY